MEGPALDRQRPSWTWLVAVFGAVPADAFLPDHRAAYYVCGLSAGAAWQVLSRRDLTSRLIFMATLVAIGLTVNVIVDEPIRWDDQRGLYWAGVLVALVLIEEYLRFRDRRASSTRAERQPAAT